MMLCSGSSLHLARPAGVLGAAQVCVASAGAPSATNSRVTGPGFTPGDIVVAGEVYELRIEVEDAYGNPVPDSTLQFTLTVTITQAGAVRRLVQTVSNNTVHVVANVYTGQWSIDTSGAATISVFAGTEEFVTAAFRIRGAAVSLRQRRGRLGATASVGWNDACRSSNKSSTGKFCFFSGKHYAFL